MNNIINNKQIILSSTVKTKNDAFKEVAKLAVLNKVVDNENDFYEALQEREKEGSTGFEDGFAIPHGKSPKIKKAAVFFIKYKNSIEWNSLDKKPVKVAIVLAIPENNTESKHIETLSEIATKLLDEEIRSTLKKSTITKKVIIEKLFPKPNEIKKEKEDSNGYVIGITACAAGVAHTYMAAKAIETYAQKNNFKVKIEKQGANGIEDKLTKWDIENANFMILAVDINPIELERFTNVPQLKVSVAEPLHNMENIWNNGLKISRNIVNKINQGPLSEDKEISKLKTSFWKRVHKNTKAGSASLKNAILSGLSYTVPVIVAATTIAAVITIINQIAGVDYIKEKANWLNTLGDTAGGAIGLLLAPLLSGYIAYALADKPGLFPGLMGGIACNAIVLKREDILDQNGNEIALINGLGFIGGLISGIIVGYMMKLARKYIKSKKFQGLITWSIYPIFGSLIIMSLILFGIGQPIALMINEIYNGLTFLQESEVAFLMGAIIGIMCTFDLGGPFNKVAWAFGYASMTQAINSNNPQLFVPYSAFWAAGIGTGWTTTIVTLIGRKYSNQEEKEAGKISWMLSSLGITEGAIPFALSDPKRVIPSFMLGGAISGGLTAAFSLGSNIPGGGFITMAGVHSANGDFQIWSAILLWLLFSIIGTIVSTLIILILKILKFKKVLFTPKIDNTILNIISLGIIPLNKKIKSLNKKRKEINEK